jgi:hypothetical protein
MRFEKTIKVGLEDDDESLAQRRCDVCRRWFKPGDIAVIVIAVDDGVGTAVAYHKSCGPEVKKDENE